MKHKKHIIALIAGLFLIAGITTGVLLLNVRCTADGTNVCFDKELQQFKIEKDAAVSVQVESEAMRVYLIETWNTLHPDAKDILDVTVRDALSIDALSNEGIPYDLTITSQTNAAFLLDSTFDMGDSVVDQILFNVPSQLQDASNVKKVSFIPNSIKGWLFAYNKTLAESMGIDLTDSNDSGLPDSFDTWEKIMAISPELLERLDYVFPLTFKDQESFYPFLTGGRWLLNFTNRGSDPGLKSHEFLKGLEFIEFLHSAPLTRPNEDGTYPQASELAWNYEEAFYDQKSLFTIVTDWMQLEAHQVLTNDTYVYAQFPSYNGVTLSPMGTVDGYVMRSTTKSPSAAAEVLRILRAPEAAGVYTSPSGRTFIYSRHSLDQLNVEPDVMQLIRAYSYSDSPPVMSLDDNPAVLSRLVYQEVDMMDILQELYDRKIDAKAAQERINERVDAWLDEHAGVTNHDS